ncbi:MAG: aminopeptidase P family protein [Bacteroidales bacterium]|nr:aminopeptidase P family protein [Candidatus Physcousia equi]
MIHTRVEQLRAWMKTHGLHAYIFPSTDPHSGEYTPEHWKARQWISGFDGSAGTAVVTLTDAALWTDSRYFLAAEEQLRDTPFQLLKQGLKGTPNIAEWLATQAHLWEEIDDINIGADLEDEYSDLSELDHPHGKTQKAWGGATCHYNYRVGLDAWCNTIASTKTLESELMVHGMHLHTDLSPFDKEKGTRKRPLWTDRPALPLSPIEIQPLTLAGEAAHNKIERVREALRQQHCDATIVSLLDEVAWLFNLRGTDVHCTPLFVSYALVTREKAMLFINKKKLTPDVKSYLKKEEIDVCSYDAIAEAIVKISEEAETPYCFLLDPSATNARLKNILDEANMNYLLAPSVIAPMKSVKNEAEIAGFRSAMLKDGVAMVKFLRWLRPAVEAAARGEGAPVTEMSADRKLTELRAEQPLFRDLSFDTIAGYGAHGAIVHYEATPDTDIVLEPHGLLLLDSGAQYQDGTTDITRTIALGPLTDEERHDYTLVLRCHIRLAMSKFPSGSSGTQLDVCARYAMWQEGINFLHGTGHGVGSYLNVHEGPHQIRMNYMPAPLQEGMTVTIEPGIYRSGKHGVRTENTMLITHFIEGEYGPFLQFEPLTLCPIDTTPIILSEMQSDEIDYLNRYHQRVYDLLSPLLDEEECEWLQIATRPVQQS